MNSTTNQPNLIELAKQGNAKAIATLINRQLQPKGITAKAIHTHKECRLRMILEADAVHTLTQAVLTSRPEKLASM